MENYSDILEKLADTGTNLALKLVAVLVIWLVGKKIISLVLKILMKTFEKTDLDRGVRQFIASLAKVIMYCILVAMLVGTLGIQTSSIVTLIGSLGLTAGLSLQGSLSNFAGGVLILVSKPFKVGDYIVATGYEGSVKSIDILYTKLATIDNKIVVIPNGTLSNSAIVNVTQMNERKVEVSVDVAYDSDLSAVRKVLENVCAGEKKILSDKSHELQIFVDKLGESGITFKIRAWVKTADYWDVTWYLNEAVKTGLDGAGITIPFNQLDVHIDGGAMVESQTKDR